MIFLTGNIQNSMTLREIIQKIREEPISESHVHELIVEWLSEDSSSMDIVMEAISMQRQRTKNLLDEMGVRLTFTTYAAMQIEQKSDTLRHQIKKNKKFYTDNKKYVKTKGIQIWKDLP